jgi:drug/metabolite transporter (DMT)-like permease
LELSTSALESTHSKPTGNQRQAVALIFFCTVLNAAAQLLFKRASAHFSLNLLEDATNVSLILGLVLYGGFTVAMVLALRQGELSMLYPIISLSYVWVTLLSYTLLGEKPNLYKTIGVVVIVIGVAILGRGGGGGK